MKNLNKLLNFHNRATNEEIYENIKDGINLDMSNLIILMCAIIIASVGLNMNATAVIIGAMLISPLMGAIIGMGYGMGTYDLKIIKKSLKVLTIEILISIITATIYFKITPITAAGTEIIARTTPTIWDVIIAFTGGIAGIVGLTRKKTGNVIPGVAIATALMPPLCTAGYGIATSQFNFFIGASYLFFINSFFITISTFVMIKFFRIPTKKQVDIVAGMKLKRNIIILTILVTIPSLISAGNMINQTVRQSNLSRFVSEQFTSDQYIISSKINESDKTIEIALFGKTLSNNDINSLNKKLPSYGFKDMTLKITQDKELNFKEYIDEIKNDNSGFIKDPSIDVDSITNSPKENFKSEATSISNEIKSIFPQIDEISLTQGINIIYADADTGNESKNTETNSKDKTNNLSDNKDSTYDEEMKEDNLLVAIIQTKDKSLEKDRDKIIDWLKTRTNFENVKLFFEFK